MRNLIYSSNSMLLYLLPRNVGKGFPLIATKTSKCSWFDFSLGLSVAMNFARALGWKHYSGALCF